MNYRKDIDGLRAIAVLAVILFHLGYLTNGYLGVDIFFVISGYLITKILYKEVNENRLSIKQFYLRRIRRIIPLVLLVNLIVLIIGLLVMLPDDLENLSQSVIATNFFSNNFLQFFTTRNYWDIVNEYKPLMHTWSLGIEEQYYMLYPFMFLILGGKRIRWILPILILFTIISLFIFILPFSEPSKFYLIPFRFFELSIGGLGAIIINEKFKDNLIDSKYTIIFIVVLLLILFVDIDLPNGFKLFFTVIVTLGILISANSKNKISVYILENKLMVGIGLISYSLYMWHQIVIAFTRYFILEKFSNVDSVIIFFVIISLSVITYLFIEQPFRNKKRIKINVLFRVTGILFVLSTSVSLYVYFRSGVIHDYPELGITKSDAKRNLHAKYNDRIYSLNRNFTNNNKIKTLVIGDSFARDWANILLESDSGNNIEISYVYDINNCKGVDERINKANLIFFSGISKASFNTLTHKHNIDTSMVWIVGTKNFGKNNGIFFNKKKNQDYCLQRTNLEKGYFEGNEFFKKEWGIKYIDLIGMVIDKNATVPVFTPECKFISQDCRHLTKSGAIYFGQLLDWKFKNQIFQKKALL